MKNKKIWKLSGLLFLGLFLGGIIIWESLAEKIKES